MTVYVDVLAALNFIVTYLTLLICCVVLKTSPSALRLLLGSLTGGAASLLLLLPDLGPAVSFLLRACVCALVTLVSFRPKSFSRFARCAGVLTGVSFLLTGAALAVQSRVGAQRIYLKNGAVYLEMSFTTLVLTAAVCFLLVSAVFRFLSPTRAEERIFTVRVKAGSMDFSVPALYDSGNLLADPLFGSAVAVVSLSGIRDALPPELIPFFSGELERTGDASAEWNGRLRVIPAKTVGESGLLPALRCDEVLVSGGGKEYITPGAVIAVSARTFGDSEYCALVGPNFFNNELKRKGKRKAKRRGGGSGASR